LWGLHNLRSRRRRREQSAEIARKLLAYQSQYPGRPTWLIGHSGGGALALYSLLALPAAARITGAILLGPAIAPDFDLRPVLPRTERGVWCVSSWGDVWFLGLGTSLVGTFDGRHSPAAGMIGFARSAVDPASRAPAVNPRSSRAPRSAPDAEEPLLTAGGPPAAPEERGPRLYELPYRLRMSRCLNFGGHFGCAHRQFVAEWIAPILRGAPRPAT
jgi:pimeloyl-ACP methyl ester carboxylesterase